MTVNHIVLFEPQIPANTGNIARTCAATNSHKSLEAFLDYLGERPLYLITKFANHTYDEVDLARDEEQFFMFGKETTGLPEEFMRENEEKCLRLPMNDTHVRSLNLSNTAAIVVYEALRQQRFAGLELVHTYDHDKLK